MRYIINNIKTKEETEKVIEIIKLFHNDIRPQAVNIILEYIIIHGEAKIYILHTSEKNDFTVFYDNDEYKDVKNIISVETYINNFNKLNNKINKHIIEEELINI